MAKLANPSINVDAEKLTDEVAKLLRINQVDQEGRSIFEIRLPNLAKCYGDDEIVIYSMTRAIKLKLENELCSNMNRVAKVNIIREGNDLIAKTYPKI